jgi:uncharacterized protein (TIGR03118 family)
MKNKIASVLVVLVLSLAIASVSLAQYQETDFVGYQPGMAHYTDPNLNAWGIAAGPDGQVCVADTANGVATFYNPHTGKPSNVVITIPPAPNQRFGPVGLPSGVVYNSTSEFVISAHGKSAPARFIFDTLDGTISGWNPAVDATHAIIMVDNSGEHPYAADYSGLAIGKNSHGSNVLYAADGGDSPTISNNRVDVFDGHWHRVGTFTDPNVASQYPGNTVFGIENEDGKLFVTFGGFIPPFGGVVDIFDVDGHLLTPNHFAANDACAGPLVNPWPIAKAPSNFGKFSNAILIGSVEDGKINAFDESGNFLGQLEKRNKSPIVIDGIWDFIFNPGGKSNNKNAELFFAAGPNADDFAGNGLCGIIIPATDDDD